ncbi:hypothetical protein TNCV_4775541 [Trichonephila clavipes]|nr:hypothetical protein TNCV_4775541 [Trichonephila clavipes]
MENRKETTIEERKLVIKLSNEASTSNTLGRSVSAETVRRVLRKAGYNGRVARKKPLIAMRVSSTSSVGTVAVWCGVNHPHTTQNTQFLLKHGDGSVMVWGVWAAPGGES